MNRTEKDLTASILMTEREHAMVQQRMAIARRLLQGATYDSLIDEFGVGSSTIALVRRVLRENGFIS